MYPTVDFNENLIYKMKILHMNVFPNVQKNMQNRVMKTKTITFNAIKIVHSGFKISLLNIVFAL